VYTVQSLFHGHSQYRVQLSIMKRYSSGQLFALRRRSSALSKSIPPSVVNCIHSLNLQRCRGCRGGVRKHRSISVVARTRLPNRTPVMDGDRRCRCLVYPPWVRLGDPDASADGVLAPAPNLYILNSNSIAKPHALDQLTVELDNYKMLMLPSLQKLILKSTINHP